MMNVCVTVGNDPTDLEVGVVNFDSDCMNYSFTECSDKHLSCRFLDLLPGQKSTNRTLKLVRNNVDANTLWMTPSVSDTPVSPPFSSSIISVTFLHSDTIRYGTRSAGADKSRENLGLYGLPRKLFYFYV